MIEQPVPLPAPARPDPLPSVAMAVAARAAATITAAALTLVVAAGGFLRLWEIDAVGINSDEAVYAGQAASIAGDSSFREYFAIFRAHPLLFQAVLSVPFKFLGVDALYGRLLTVAFGLATVLLAYKLGALLYGRRAGVAAALVLALMPYHVVVSRQVLLDVPLAFFATLALYLLARYATSGRASWLYASGGALGLAFLSKEAGVLLLGAVYVFLALTPSVPVRLRHVAVTLAVMVVTIAPYPLSLVFAGKSDTGKSFLLWQLFRRPNHGFDFYAANLPLVLGPLVLAAALLGLLLLRRENSWREALLLSWIAVPVAFFELWPVKGFQYLLPIAPPIAVLAGRMLGRWQPSLRAFRRSFRLTWVGAALAVVVVASLARPSWQRIQVSDSRTFLAGSGGVPGGRESGEWVRTNVPEGATILALGPSMANILQFYGQRKAYGLSVSPNPLHRNPVYEPVENPDLRIRNNDLQYLVWDAYSAARSPFFSRKLLRYVSRYNGRPVHTAFVGSGTDRRAVIVIYEVRP